MLVGGLIDDCAVISPSTPADPAIFFVIDVTAHPAQLSATLAAAPATLLATLNDDVFSVEFGSGVAVSGYKY